MRFTSASSRSGSSPVVPTSESQPRSVAAPSTPLATWANAAPVMLLMRMATVGVPPPGEGAGMGVGDVVQVPDDLHHPAAQLLRHRVVAGQHARHARDGDARTLRHVADGGPSGVPGRLALTHRRLLHPHEFPTGRMGSAVAWPTAGDGASRPTAPEPDPLPVGQRPRPSPGAETVSHCFSGRTGCVGGGGVAGRARVVRLSAAGVVRLIRGGPVWLSAAGCGRLGRGRGQARARDGWCPSSVRGRRLPSASRDVRRPSTAGPASVSASRPGSRCRPSCDTRKVRVPYLVGRRQARDQAFQFLHDDTAEAFQLVAE